MSFWGFLLGSVVRGKARFFLSLPVLVLLVLLAVAIVFVKSEFAAEKICGMLKARMQKSLGLQADVSVCSVDLLPPSLDVNGLTLSSEQEGKILFVKQARFELDSLDLLAGDFGVERILLDAPQLHLHLSHGRLKGIPVSEISNGQEPVTKANYRFPGKVRVEGGRLDLVVDGFGLLQLRGLELKASSEEEGTIELDMKLGKGNVDVVGAQYESVTIGKSRCQAVVVGQGVEQIQCSVDVDEAILKLKGELTRTYKKWVPKLQLSISGPLDVAHRVFPQIPLMTGNLVLSAETDVERGFEAVKGFFELQNFGLDSLSNLDFHSEFYVDPEGLRLSKIQASLPAGRVTGDLSVDFDELIHTKGLLIVENASLIKALAAAGLQWHYIDLLAGGPVAIKGRLKGKNGPRIGVSLSRFKIDKMVIQIGKSGKRVLGFNGPSTVDAKAVFYKNRVRISSARILTGKSEITAKGSIRFSDFGLTGYVGSEKLLLEDLCPIMDVDFQGISALDIDFNGTVLNPTLQAVVYTRDFGIEQHPVGIFQGKVEMKNFRLGAKQVRLARHGGVVRASGSLDVLPPYAVSLAADLSRIKLPELVSAIRKGKTPSYMEGWVGGRVDASGELYDPQLQFQLAFADLRLWGQHFSEAGAIGKYKAGAWTLDLLEARMGPGWIFARGRISPGSDLDFTAYTTGLRAESFEGMLGYRDWIDYRLDLHFAVQGPIYAPALDGWARVYDTTLSGHKVPDTNITAKANAENFQVDGKILGEAARLHLKADLLRDLPFEGNVEFDTGRIEGFSRILGASKGDARFAGKLSASGSLMKPSSMNAHLTMKTAKLVLGGFAIENLGDMDAYLDKGEISLARCDLRGPQSRLTLNGGGLLMKGPRIRAKGLVDLRLLPLVTNWIPRAKGSASVFLDFTGSWTSPLIKGSLDLDAKRVRVVGLPSDLRNVSGHVVVSHTGLDIEKLDGRFGNGDFSAWGWARFGRNLIEKIAVTAEVNKVRYKVSDKLWAKASGVLTLTKERDELAKLKGQVRVEQGEYKEQVSLVSLSDGLFRRRRPLAKTYDKRNEVLKMDIDLTVPGNFKALYNLELVQYQAKMKGELKLTGSNERLGLVGELESTDGHIFYLSKDFKVQSTRVQFLDKYSISPRFDVVATRSESVDRGDEGKTNYDVDLSLHGQGDDVKVSLRSSPPLDERDIVTLLSLGVTSRDMERIKTDDLIGLGGEIFLRSLKAEERLRKYFPFPPGLIKPKYFRMRSRYSNLTQTTTPRVEAGVEVSIVSPNLSLGYSRSLYVENDQILELVYDLDKNISTQLRWQSASENNYGDLGVDLKLDWEW